MRQVRQGHVTNDGYHTVVFDLGAVVLGWDPAPAFASVLNAEEIPGFLDRIDFGGWNRLQDAGRSFDDGERSLIAEHGEQHAETIRAYRTNFTKTLTGMVPGTGAILAELQQAGITLYALTNWSAETFPHARQRFGLLSRFDNILVSGAELLAKPDPAIFELARDRFGFDPARTVFVDDGAANVDGAESIGITGIQFVDADALRERLVSLGLLGPRVPITEPVYHLTQRDVSEAAARAGAYPWSTRDRSYDAEGYVHLSYARQLPDLRRRLYADRAEDQLVVLRLDPTSTDPIVEEDLDLGEPYPHLYAPLPLDRVFVDSSAP